MASLTHAEIVHALAVINRGVPGVRKAYASADLPQGLTTLPCAITLLGPDDYGKFGACEYWVRVFVADARTGNPAQAYVQCLTMSTAFRAVYSQLRGVGDRYIDRQHLTVKGGFGSTGFAYTLKWGQSEYYGFQINIPLAQQSIGG